MERRHQINAIIEKHMPKMLAEISQLDNPPGWIPENAETILANAVFACLEYGNAVEKYLEKEDMLKL